MNVIELLEEAPIIAAVKDWDGLEKAQTAPVNVVFVLFGDVCNIGKIIKRLKAAGKFVVVHLDLIEGLESKPISVQFLKETTQVNGIISTKISVITAAHKLGLTTVMRFFVLDSLSVENIKKQTKTRCIDFVEILPGIAPKIIKKLVKELSIPLITGGLISDKEDVITALQQGALALSTTNSDIWEL
ncbi:glycerol-3-phosphate responsive antiterminator [Candidatus Epulonipiscium viviparus]|uniref:glycerol-3-phosphate responsive antiterminator n=1 Tax=Candidatus Epulonipiscium viviparus TaxID=420336 RepID=UPI002738144A|nr:glycerol-3-phosphate responsive antiterminator [Candidatus Epulopiscium viviparus]